MLKLASIFSAAGGAVTGAVAMGIMGGSVESVGVGAVAGGLSAGASFPFIYKFSEAVAGAIAPGPSGLALLPFMLAVNAFGPQAVAVATAGATTRFFGLMP